MQLCNEEAGAASRTYIVLTRTYIAKNTIHILAASLAPNATTQSDRRGSRTDKRDETRNPPFGSPTHLSIYLFIYPLSHEDSPRGRRGSDDGILKRAPGPTVAFCIPASSSERDVASLEMYQPRSLVLCAYRERRLFLPDVQNTPRDFTSGTSHLVSRRRSPRRDPALRTREGGREEGGNERANEQTNERTTR